MIPIKFRPLIRREIRRPIEDFYKFKPTRYKIVAKWLWRALTKIGALHQGFQTVETYSYGKPEYDTVRNAIMAQVNNVMVNGDKLEDYAIVIGAATFEQLVSIPTYSQHVTFPVGSFAINEISADSKLIYHSRYDNIPVHVVPYLEGVALIPKVVIEKRDEMKVDKWETINDPYSR